MKPKIISIIGPTAVGKTKLGIEVAKQVNGEVINGDSMQVYRGFDIGTAKATPEEQAGIAHHLIDFLEPTDDYSAADFRDDVKAKVEEIHIKSKTPVIVGGTGFYVQAALYDFNFSNVKRDELYSEDLYRKIEREGVESSFERLKQVDPDQARKIHPNNIRRVIRALEVYETTGKPLSLYEKEQEMNSPYQPWLIGLRMERELLYERINQRVYEMVEKGLFEEVKELYDQFGENVQPMKGIGYKELIPYFKGLYSKDEAIELVKRNSRRFAKRQLTYYRNKLHSIHWYNIDPASYHEIFSGILSDLEGFIQIGENS